MKSLEITESSSLYERIKKLQNRKKRNCKDDKINHHSLKQN